MIRNFNTPRPRLIFQASMLRILRRAYRKTLTATIRTASPSPILPKFLRTKSIAAGPYTTARIPSEKYRKPRPIRTAVINFGQDIPNAPADSTNTLNGVGGGSSEGTTMARIPCLWYHPWTFNTLSLLNRLRRNASPPLRPTEYSRMQPMREPIVVNAANFNIAAGSFSENVINRMSFTSGSDKNDESQTARSIKPKPP